MTPVFVHFLRQILSTKHIDKVSVMLVLNFIVATLGVTLALAKATLCYLEE